MHKHYRTAYQALSRATRELRAAAPDARDYDLEAFPAARGAHHRRLRSVRALKTGLLELAKDR